MNSIDDTRTDRLGILRKFWRTKRAVSGGQPLYDWTNSELDQGNYLRPITFNVMESVLAAIPGMVIMIILFIVIQPGMLNTADGVPETATLYKNLVLLCLLFTLYLFVPPVFTGTLAPFAGAGSIRIEDRTSRLKRRATRAYLYFDGTYGMYTQSVISICWIVVIWISINEVNPIFAGLTLIVFLLAGLHQLYLSFSKIPKEMFAINGYSNRVRRFWQKKLADDPPWNRYGLYYIGGGFLSGIVLGMILAAFEGIILPMIE